MNENDALVPNPLISAEPQELQQAHTQLNQRLLAQFADWLGHRGLSKNTQETYGRATRDFSVFLGGRSILYVEHSDVLQYLTGLYRDGRSKQTVRLRIGALRCFQKWLSLVERPNSGALGRIKLPKLPKRIAGYHTLEEIEKMLAAAANCRERALLEFAFATACRVSELTGIRVEDIDFENRTFKVLGKGNKERVGLFNEAAALALRYYLGGRTEGLLFPVTRRHLQTIFASVGVRVGIKTHPHAWRHSCATALLNGGMDLRYLQEFMGHANVSTTARYLHSTMKDLLDTHSKFHPHSSEEAK